MGIVVKTPFDVNQIIFNATNEALFLIAMEGEHFRYIKNNPAHKKQTGINSIEGKTPVDLVGQELGEVISGNYMRCVKARKPISYEETLHLPAGERTWYTTLTPVFQDNEVYIVGSSTDITGLKNAEHQLRLNLLQSESLIKVLQHHSDSIQEYLDFALHEVLNLTESQFGYIFFYDETTKEFTVNSWSSGAMKECAIKDKVRVYQLDKTGIWGEAVRQKKPIIINDFAAPNPLKKGYPKGHVPISNFLTIPVFDNQKIVAVVGVANKKTDYSEIDVLQMTIVMNNVWKVVEQIRSEQKYRAMFDQSASGICNCSLEGRYIDANKTFCELVGYTLPELKTMSFADITHSDDIQKSKNYFSAMQKGNLKTPSIEKRYITKDGSTRHVIISGSTVKDANAYKCAVITIQDITQQKQLEKNKLQMESHLRNQQKLESIGILAGGVAHEINNPINGIMNYGQLILDGSAQEEFKEYATEIIHETDRISTIVKNLLQFSRQEKQVYSKARIEDIVHKTISLINTLFKDDQINLTVDVPENLPDIKCRSQQIQQVLMNLLTNARDALNDKYKGYDENKRLMLSCSEITQGRQRWIRVTVNDHGNGIPKNIQDKIFDPFFTTKRQNEGTGLGLAISYGIVKDHRGKLTYKTKQGKGTTFFVDLPACANLE